MTHLDTSFAVDLLREARRSHPGAAMALHAHLADEPVALSVHAMCELLAGAELARDQAGERRRVLSFCAAVHIAYPDERFAPVYAGLLAWLQRRGQTVGAMDLLIATAAVVDEAALVTRHVAEFRRIPGLDLIEY